MSVFKISRAADSIWRTADLEYGDPYDDEEEWFRDRHNMWQNYGSYEKNEELMTLVPGWDEAKRRGWKPLGGGGGPIAYRGTGDRFEFIKPKHVNPDEPHWENIPQRWVRYSQGEGGMQQPYVMHADTFKDALNDREVGKWALYKSRYDPESGEFYRELNPNWPGTDRPGGGGTFSPAAHTKDFEKYRDGPGYFENVKNWAEGRDKKRMAGES